MAHISALIVDLTFGEEYDAPQRAQSSQPGLRPEPTNVFTTEKTESTEKRKEERSGDSLSVTSVFSVVKYRTYAEGIGWR